jgi:murein DD-endopeptidase MepM/ murein hydrolase activator NlpD
VIVARRAAVLVVAVVLAGCGSNTPAPTATPAATQAAAAPPATPSASATPADQPSANPGAANQPVAATGLHLPWDTSKVAAHTVECAYNQEGILGAPPNTGTGKAPGCVMHRDGPAGSSKDAFALDLDLAKGDTVVAVASGTVRWAKAYPATSSWTCYGISVAVDTAMSDGSVRTAMYAHLDSASVASGQTVSAGQALGAAGDSGLGATWQNPDPAKQADHGTCAGSGVHLHLALYTNAKYLVDASGTATSPPYDGSSTEPKPWLDCQRVSTLGTPPAGEDASCTGLHAGDKLTYTGPGGAPVTPPTVISGTWVAPNDGAKLTTSSLTLSAKASVTVSKVAFSVRWGSTIRPACSATKAGSGGAWSCKADLWKLGAPLGKLTVSFDVTDSQGQVANAPDGTRSVTFDAPPPQPTGVVVAALGAGNSIDCSPDRCDYNPSEGNPSPWRLTWKSVTGATGYRVYVAYSGWYAPQGDICNLQPITMPRHFLANVGAGRSSLDGTWTASGSGTKADPVVMGSTYYVVALNAAGSSKASASRQIWYLQNVPECAGH